MIPQVDDAMNKFACFEAPIIDAISEVSFILAGLVGASGIYSMITGKTGEGIFLIGSSLMGLFASSYSKEISQSVQKSCRT